MSSTLRSFLFEGKFDLKKQISIKSWQIENNESTKFVVQQYYAKNDKAKDSYKHSDLLIKNSKKSESNYFVLYEKEYLINEYYFIIKEFCKVTNFNRTGTLVFHSQTDWFFGGVLNHQN